MSPRNIASIAKATTHAGTGRLTAMPSLTEWIDCVGLPVEKCNGYRARRGLPLLENATPAPPDHQSINNKTTTIKGCGKSIPSLPKRIYNYGAAVTKWTASGRPVRTQEQIDTLLAICKECPLFNAEISHCSVCGCPLGSGKDALKNKLAMATEDCPHPDGSKWKATA